MLKFNNQQISIDRKLDFKYYYYAVGLDTQNLLSTHNLVPESNDYSYLSHTQSVFRSSRPF